MVGNFGVIDLILKHFMPKDQRILALVENINFRMNDRFAREELSQAPCSGILEGIDTLKESVIPGYEDDIRNGTFNGRPKRVYRNVLNATMKSALQLLKLAQTKRDASLEAFALQIIRALQVMIPLDES